MHSRHLSNARTPIQAQYFSEPYPQSKENEMATSGTFGGSGSTADEIPQCNSQRRQEKENSDPLTFSFSRQNQEVAAFTLFDNKKRTISHVRYGSHAPIQNKERKSSSFIELNPHKVSDSLDGAKLHEAIQKRGQDKAEQSQAHHFKHILISPTTAQTGLRAQFFYPKPQIQPTNFQQIEFRRALDTIGKPAIGRGVPSQQPMFRKKDQILQILTQIQGQPQSNGRYAYYAGSYNRRLMKTIQFWLVRHGQTQENVKRILCGQQGGVLTPLGIKQAQALGKRLQNEIFDAAFVSDLARTVHTFECIQQHMVNKCEVNLTPLIREKHAGALDGQSLDVPKQLAAQQKLSIREFRPENGENWVDVMDRAKQFLLLVVKKYLLSTSLQQQQKGEIEQVQVQQQQTIVQGSVPQLKSSSLQKPMQAFQPQKRASTIGTNTKNGLVQKQQQSIQVKPSIQGLIQVQGKVPTQRSKSTSSKVIPRNDQIKILGVSHGGFIMEFTNLVNLLMEQKTPQYTNDSVNCSITIYEITFSKLPDNEEDILNQIQIKVILKNDNQHCKNLK